MPALSVKARLIGGFTLIILLLIGAASTAIVSLRLLRDDIRVIIDERQVKTSIANEVIVDLLQLARYTRTLLLFSKTEEIQGQIAKIDKARAETNVLLGKLEASANNGDEKTRLATIETTRKPYGESEERFISLVRAGQRDAAQALLFGETRDLQAKYLEAVRDLVKYEVAQTDLAGHRAEKSVQRQIVLLSVIAVLGVVLAAVLATLIIRRLLADLGAEPAEVKEVVGRIANGDLTQRLAVQPGDQSSLLASVAIMQDRLRELVGKIHGDADSVRSSAAQVTHASGEVSIGAARQSEASSAIAASVEQMTVSVRTLADNAAEARQLAEDSRRLSEEGNQVIEAALSDIVQVAETVKSAATIVQRLGDQSQEVSQVVTVIREIADQTNLLALNAAIEAARAGEAGRGFAVVADEVRKLAERTSQSTAQIADTVTRIQTGTQEAVSSIETGVTQVEEGVVEARQAGAAIEQIRAGSERVLEVIGDISAALSEQSAASTEIARNVEAIAQMAEENAAVVKSAESSAGELEHLSGSLRQTVDAFRV